MKILVGQGPGGPSDIMARLVARELGERLDQAVVVENHPGAAGVVALRLLARAAADGYTLMASSNAAFGAAVIAPDTADLDPQRAFAPVGRFARGGYVFVVRAALGVASLDGFIAAVRRRGEPVAVSTVGAGSNSARALALLGRATGIPILDVPYNGGALALHAAVSGHVDANFIELGLAVPVAASGALRILAAASRHRLALAPDVPTFAELGYPAVVTDSWYGMFAPAATPTDVIARLVSTLHSTVADPDVRRQFVTLGCEPIVETPEEFAVAILQEIEQVRSLAAPVVR